MPYRDENSDSFVSDVFGRVVIPIMANPTSGTSPETIRKRKLLIAMAASEHNCEDGNQRPTKTKFRLRHLALYSICRNVSRCAASATDLASLVLDMPLRFSVSHAIVLFSLTTEVENL